MAAGRRFGGRGRPKKYISTRAGDPLCNLLADWILSGAHMKQEFSSYLPDLPAVDTFSMKTGPSGLTPEVPRWVSEDLIELIRWPISSAFWIYLTDPIGRSNH